jgi:hypothetical protein
MWPLGIVVADVDSEHALEMPPIQDEEPVQALGPHRPDPAFRVSIRAGRLHRRADHLERAHGGGVPVAGHGDIMLRGPAIDAGGVRIGREAAFVR